MKHTIGNFSGGLTDIPVGDNPVALDCLNFHVKEDGGLVVRDGCEFTFAQLPSGEHRVAWMGQHEGSYFAVSAKNVYVWDTDQWVTLTPFGISDTVFAYGDYDSIVSAAVVGRDLVFCTTPAVGDTGANVPMRVIYVDAFTGWAGGWSAFPLGLPPVAPKYDTTGNLLDPYQTMPTQYSPFLFNFGAAFYYTITSRGRKRDFYGPLLSWQVTVNSSDGPSAWNRFLMSCVSTGHEGDAHNGYLAFYLPQPLSATRYCDFTPWVNGADDRYPTSIMKLSYFRSKVNSSQLYSVYTFDNTTVGLDPHYRFFIDGQSQSTPAWQSACALQDYQLGTPAPFVDGQIEFDGCPPMELISECNGFLIGTGVREVAWQTSPLISGTTYGGWSRVYTFRSERVRQSVPGMPDIWPRSFYVDLDSTCSALGGINGVGFSFTPFKAYRLDGAYDQFGSGGLRKKLLSDGVGCLSPASVLRFGQTLYWLGDDGFYQSNGVEVAPVSLKMRTRFGGRVCTSGASDPVNRRLFWVLDNGTFIVYPDYGTDPQNRCFVEWEGAELHNSCVLADGLCLYRGRTDGRFVVHGSNMGDCDVAFEAVYRTPYVGFGDPICVKSQQRVDVLVDNVGVPYSVHLHSYRDSAAGDVYSTVQPIVVSGSLSSSEGPFALTRGVVPYKRYLSSNDLRCHSRSMRVAIRGADLGSAGITLTYSGVIGGYPTFRLSKEVPSAIVVGSLLFVDGCVDPLEVCVVSSDTISVRSSVDFAVDQTAATWSVHGPIPSGVGLHGLVLHYTGSSDNLQGGES